MLKKIISFLLENIMHNKVLSFTVVHKGKGIALKDTLNSIINADFKCLNDNFSEIIVVASGDLREMLKIKNTYINYCKFVINKDKSIYDAMNIAQKEASGKYILYINSGDKLIASPTHVCNELDRPRCIQLRYFIVSPFDNKKYEKRNAKYGYFPRNHQSFIAPLPHKYNELIMFNEYKNFFADAQWMQKNIDKYGLLNYNKFITEFTFGGISTYPNLGIALRIIKSPASLRFKIKYTIKAFLCTIIPMRLYCSLYFLTLRKIR